MVKYVVMVKVADSWVDYGRFKSPERAKMRVRTIPLESKVVKKEG